MSLGFQYKKLFGIIISRVDVHPNNLKLLIILRAELFKIPL